MSDAGPVAWLRGVLDQVEQVIRDAADASAEPGTMRDLPSEGVWADREALDEDEQLLADIAAKRAILDAHELAERHTEFGADDWRIGHADGLREAVRLLASAYAHHPGYREEWRPDAVRIEPGGGPVG